MFTNKRLSRLSFLTEKGLCLRCEKNKKPAFGSFCTDCARVPLERFIEDETFEPAITFEMHIEQCIWNDSLGNPHYFHSAIHCLHV